MTTDPILEAPRTIAELRRLEPIQRTTWRVQRVGWWVLLTVTIAGTLGLLGGGPLSRTETRQGGATVRYDAVLRRQADTDIVFDIPSSAGRARLTLPARYMDAVEIADIQPAPLAAYATQRGQTFLFLAPRAHARIRLTVRASSIGWLDFPPVVNAPVLPTHPPLVLP